MRRLVLALCASLVAACTIEAPDVESVASSDDALASPSVRAMRNVNARSIYERKAWAHIDVGVTSTATAWCDSAADHVLDGACTPIDEPPLRLVSSAKSAWHSPVGASGWTCAALNNGQQYNVPALLTATVWCGKP